MNQTDYDALVASLKSRRDKRSGPSTKQIILAEARKVDALTAPMVRVPTGRADNCRREFDDLMRFGLLRYVGDRNLGIPGPDVAHYVIVAPADVEREAEAYASRVKPKKKSARRGRKAQLAELPKRTSGSYEAWHRARRSLIELAANVDAQIPKVAFWEAVPEDEIEGLVEALADAFESLSAGARAVEALWMRVEDDEARERIMKMVANTNGRTDNELRSIRNLAVKLNNKRRVLDGD